MIDGRYQRSELSSQKPTDGGHERLKAAEEQSNDKSLVHIELLHAQPLANGNCERVHGKADGNQEQLE